MTQPIDRRKGGNQQHRKEKRKGEETMKKRIAILLVLVMSLLMLGGAAPAGAEAARKVTGSFQWWFPGFHAWGEVNVHEVAPGEAKGQMQLKEYDEELGWRRWKAHAICVAFGEGFDGAPAASFVIQIDRISGWGPGEVGQYMKLWGSDGGMPATEGDLAGVVVFPPTDKQPGCGYKRPKAYWPLAGGDLVIHD
jgi:hypothetical protein